MSDELVDAFDQCIPEAFQRDSLRALCQIYRDTAEYCEGEFPHTEAHDVRPHIRRARFEASWRVIAASHPQLTAEARPNHKATSFFTEVRGGSVVLTQSLVTSDNAIVRRAAFRNTRAQSSQLTLAFIDRQEPPADAKLFAILIHSEGDGLKNRPAFARVVFPNQDCTDYVGTGINLFGRYPEILNDVYGSSVQTIEDELSIAIRPSVRRANRTTDSVG